MPCYHPVKGYLLGTKENGKKDILLKSYRSDYIFQGKKSREWLEHFPDEPTPDFLKKIESFIPIPCGACIGCQEDYSRQWCNRCLCELQMHSSAYFVTLTYDNLHLPYGYITDAETGVLEPVPSLRRRDVQLFFKRLRNAYDCRYYGSAEYGPSTMRPHYHIILFGLELSDLQFYTQRDGYTLYSSPELEKIWNNGLVVVGDVTNESIAYTARYVRKKLLLKSTAKFRDDDFADIGIEMPFSFMSLKPGIGLEYARKHPEIVESGFLYLPTLDGARKVYTSRYFDSKYEVDNEDEYAMIKEKRSFFAEEAEKIKDSLTDKSRLDRLLAEELHKKRSLSALKRGDF